MEIGGRIAELRNKQDLSQRELARRLGKSPSYINRIEKGEKIPNLKLIQQIASILDED
ncbi:MAG: helix-turn-helix transcriptional regulator [Bacillus sp. (in: Bacteria)]|nr:helix-turn-helix transcriptional regulator [Bacillus sp. (in: firmicutes)]